MEARTPAEVLEYTAAAGSTKANRPVLSQLILGFLAGAFIAFAAQASNMAAFNLLSRQETYGLGRTLAGFVFGIGLMLVLTAGAELFTGNTLIVVSVLEKKTRVTKMLFSWLLVYAGNFAGSIFIAFLMAQTGLFSSGAHLLGGMTIKIAFAKTSLSFGSAFILGLLCNWLVCLAVWISFAARDVSGKLLTCFFVIGLFVLSGFEHSIANMYYIPAGIFAKANPVWAAASTLPPPSLASLTWPAFLVKNLLPVTLGNIVGGAGFVGFLYWLVFRKR